MSEKVTFGELIESIAEETEHSKQFTHDFLKDFVDVINAGLEEDGKVNIAGFGKFKLKRVDEREGYNPQTEEKITIPAHNKVVFKPYKDLRELVNAPYAHMEPQLIEEEEAESSDKDHPSPDQQAIDSQIEEPAAASDNKMKEKTEQPQEDKQSDPDTPESAAEQELNEDDFIPTAPPTSHQQDSNEDKNNNKDQADAKEESPFDFGDQEEARKNISESSPTESSDDTKDDDNGDIVEFRATQVDREDDLLEAFISSEEEKEQHSDTPEDFETAKDPEPDTSEPNENENELEGSVSGEEDTNEKEPTKSEEEVLAEEVEELEETAKDLKKGPPNETDQPEKEPPLSPAIKHGRTKRGSSFTYVAAAAIVLLLIAAGAWYYSTVPTNNTILTSSSEEITTSTDATQDNNTQQQLTGQQEDESSQQTTQNQSQSPTQPSKAQSTRNATPNNESVEIEEGQTLWSLAEDRYGNPRLWPWIYGNNGSLDNPDLIYAGSSLSVPLPSGPQSTLTSTDSVGVAKGFIATYKWYKSNEQPKAKDHLWAAKLYHNDLQQLADIPIDKTDLSYANKAR